MTSLQTLSRKDRRIHEGNYDPCKAALKSVEPSVYQLCNVVYEDGRRQWHEFLPVDLQSVVPR